jgi:DNA-binding transcriptional LysR family regulator
MRECSRGGLKHPRIVQEGWDEATILSLVLHEIGVGIVIDTARWRCPEGVIVLPIADLNLPFPLSLTWRKDNGSPLLAHFVATVRPLVTQAKRNPNHLRFRGSTHRMRPSTPVERSDSRR